MKNFHNTCKGKKKIFGIVHCNSELIKGDFHQ